MNGRCMLYLDQYGNKYFAATIRELHQHVGGGRISKMYIDGNDGKTRHVGYVIGKYWLSAYIPYAEEI